MDEAVARVFDQICVDAKLDRASVDGVTLASTVLAAFKTGSLQMTSCWRQYALAAPTS